ncbi:class I SAM-dependent methyltransferase [Alkalicoccus chagannorensis]|uniref:class I SAM-dependent methyltransferase n=1 Tax=Alkalicoccus chagannorensis TaxID=427072 RepID=UPI000405AFA2|nr:class I SAM-dependent methyltransferase [Alkalicoccus chagannorensis]
MKEGKGNQQQRWERALAGQPDKFGTEASPAAVRAAKAWKEAGITHVLELGGGQGRDACYFASQGFHVTVLDYTESGTAAVREKAAALGLEDRVHAVCHDVKTPLPFKEAAFDACYSHMLFCMAFTGEELERLVQRLHRVLRPGGEIVYTVRHTGDPHYGTGSHHGGNIYESSGYVVHYFDQAMVQQLTAGYDLHVMDTFEEGTLPKKLYYVHMRKAST